MKKQLLIIVLSLLFVIIISPLFVACEETKPTMEEICEGKCCIECGASAEYYSSMATHPSNAYRNVKENSYEMQSGSFYRVFYCNDCLDKRTAKEVYPLH